MEKNLISQVFFEWFVYLKVFFGNLDETSIVLRFLETLLINKLRDIPNNLKVFLRSICSISFQSFFKPQYLEKNVSVKLFVFLIYDLHHKIWHRMSLSSCFSSQIHFPQSFCQQAVIKTRTSNFINSIPKRNGKIKLIIIIYLEKTRRASLEEEKK